MGKRTLPYVLFALGACGALTSYGCIWAGSWVNEFYDHDHWTYGPVCISLIILFVVGVFVAVGGAVFGGSELIERQGGGR